MSTLNEDFIIATSLDRTADLQQQGFITHALCRAGSCTFRLGAREHRVAAGDCLIIPQQSLLLHDYAPSADFRIEVIYVSAPFTEVATPQSNYGMRGHLALFEDPVMHVTNQQALLMQQFMSLLDRGEFVQHRDVAWYADALCVTPKHLSEVCREVSGQSAMYWITRYTALDISRTLRNRALTLEEISDYYGFSTTNYFVRYVQKHLCASPSALRE